MQRKKGEETFSYSFTKLYTYSEILKYLEEMSGLGSIMGTESIRRLCERLGNPQDLLQVIHIAGTNGKGSTVAYLCSILKTSGYLTGAYISPVIKDYKERFSLNGRPILIRDLTQVMSMVIETAEQIAEEGFPHPTVFEMETAAAFCYFAAKGCDFVVLETGMGGIEDATNIIAKPIATVFASISMDHMQILGKTLTEIAGQKAGIIKPGCPVISTWQDEEAAAVLENTAREKGCDFVMASRDRLSKVKYGIQKQYFSYQTADGTIWKKVETPLAGTVQIDNASLALEVISSLVKSGYNFLENKILQGLADTRWPGRFEVLSVKPYVILDGAHNENAAIRLAESLRFYFTNKKLIYIMGILKDKEYEKIVANTSSLAEHIITITPPDNPRALSAHELAVTAKEYHPSVTEAGSIEEAIEMAYLLSGRQKDSAIVIFGSLSFLGKVYPILKKERERKR